MASTQALASWQLPIHFEQVGKLEATVTNLSVTCNTAIKAMVASPMSASIEAMLHLMAHTDQTHDMCDSAQQLECGRSRASTHVPLSARRRPLCFVTLRCFECEVANTPGDLGLREFLVAVTQCCFVSRPKRHQETRSHLDVRCSWGHVSVVLSCFT
jgi:hypothetical protein